ncbi:MAG: aminopeptidase P N-terminal domain-containing protein [Candidatus Aminicenantaceae bacterium]
MRKRRSFILLLTFLFSMAFLNLQLFSDEVEIGSSDFKERRDKLSSFIPDGVAIIINYSGSFGRARANPEFYYLTGVDVPDAKLILIPETVAEKTSRPEFWRTTLYLPSKDPRRGVWDDPQLFPGKKAEEATGIENTADLSVFYSDVSKLGSITDTVYLSYRTNVRSLQRLPSDLEFVENIRKILPSVRIKNFASILDEMRWKKSTREIDVMRKACKITVEAFKEAARFTKPGIYEYEIEALITYIFRKNGSQSPAFIIIASGPNSCILHHMNNDRKMEEGDLLKIDIGTIYKSYSTDLTRTIPVSGKFSPEQKKIYNIVLEAQKKAISIVKPGVTLAEVHKTVMDVINEAGYGKYLIHGTSHTLSGGSHYKSTTLGLSLKGMYGKYKMNRHFAADNPLVPGSIFTIEPGIYIPVKNLGIRIEDDILVTENGYEILTKDAPRELDEIEKLMKEKTVYVK